jgi:hypothetical protein
MIDTVDELSGDRDGVHGMMRPCRVSALTADDDVQPLAVRSEHSVAYAHASHGALRVDVQGDDGLHALQSAGIYHLEGPSMGLLGRLEYGPPRSVPGQP